LEELVVLELSAGNAILLHREFSDPRTFIYATEIADVMDWIKLDDRTRLQPSLT
jgi:hypothetical protein